jgi:hypothetical protein
MAVYLLLRRGFLSLPRAIERVEKLPITKRDNLEREVMKRNVASISLIPLK